MTIGEKIQYWRKERGLTQTELAEKLGKTYAAVSKYERNENEISSETLKDIAKILDISTDYLLGISDNPKRDIFKEPMILAASMKDSLDISDMPEHDKELLRQFIENRRALNKKLKDDKKS